MKRPIAVLVSTLLASLASPNVSQAGDRNDVLRGLVEAGGIHQASKEDVEAIMKGVNSDSEFEPVIECKFSPQQGITIGHTVNAEGEFQQLDTRPKLPAVEFQIGSWSLGGELEGKTDVRMRSEAKTALEQGWLVSGAERPGGHPALLMEWTSTQKVNGQLQLLQQHRVMIGLSFTPAPAYYTQSHAMKANDVEGQKSMSVTTLAGSCTQVK